MGRRIAPLTVDRLRDLPAPCVGCAVWECPPGRDVSAGAERAKADWCTSVLLEWGSPGRIAYVDDVPAGYLTYAPPAYVPRSPGFATAPVAADAVLLLTGRVDAAYAGQGLARHLVQVAARDLHHRGVRAIEAFGRTGRDGPTATRCLLPVDFLTAVGFRTVREHPRHPRLRLDLRSALSWRADLEAAVDRLLAPVRAPVTTALPRTFGTQSPTRDEPAGR